MIMADVLTYFLLISGALLVFIAHWLGAYALFPGLVEGCRGSYGRRPVAATLLGLAVLVPALAAGLALTHVGHPLLNLAVLLALTAPLLLALLGSAGLALRVGAGLAAPGDAGQPWRRVLRGGAVLALIFLLPLIGWFVLLPWTLVSGLGAALLALRGARPAAPLLAAAPASAPVAPV